MIPKVSYLQYEIMELVFKNKLREINSVTGYPEGSLVLESAIKALGSKGLIDKEKKLTDKGIKLLNGHYAERHEHKRYTLNELILEKPLTLHISSENTASRWYQYLEDFPPEFVAQMLAKYKLHKKYFVFDPFVGSGTTLIESKKRGYKSAGIDINPAMTFISLAKLDWTLDTKKIEKYYYLIIKKFLHENFKQISFDVIGKTSLANMPKKELNQWLSPVKQVEVAYLLHEIKKIKEKKYQNILMLALIKSAINASYVAFCPGTTFYPFRKKRDVIIEFKDAASQIIADLEIDERLKNNNHIISEVVLGSSKHSDSLKQYSGNVDLIITSPPYPNDLEYTRQTRLEMYMLGVVNSMQDVQQVKRGMVKGSTKLIYNTDEPIAFVKKLPSLKKITKQVAFNLKDKNWGFDYPKMLEMYFSDMFVCMQNYYTTLVKGGTAVLVVGDQTTKGVLVPVAEILAELAKIIGFTSVHIEFHRQRRSTGHDLEIPEENLILTK